MQGETPSDEELRSALRYVLGECTEQEAQRIARWLAADPSRQSLLRDLRRMRDAAPEAPGLGQYDVTRARHVLERRRRQSPAAASLQLSARREVPAHRSPLVAAAIAASVVGILATGGTFAVMQHRHSAHEYATAPGERLTVKLDDGTLITLAPQSSLRIPETDNRGVREARLEGEAFFRVVHDSTRPFRVVANGVSVADLGTVFDVHAYASDSVVEVAVEEGRVAVEAPHVVDHAVTPLEAGDVATVSAHGSVTRSHPADLAQYLAWTRGTLAFHAAPLRTVLVEFGRWYGMQLYVTDSAMLDQLVTASWSAEPAHEALDDLAGLLHARQIRQGRTVWLAPITPDTAHTSEPRS
jgi:transmembrane sensor